MVLDYLNNKHEIYALLLSQIEALVEGNNHPISILSNASALLSTELKDVNWVGFYLMFEGRLVLGPFQGKAACMNIAVGKGVCGTAVLSNATQVVEDVHQFPGHIACDSASNSEIVIPIRNQGRVMGVLDIDSPLFSRFDRADAEGLNKIVRVIEQACDWNIFLSRK